MGTEDRIKIKISNFLRNSFTDQNRSKNISLGHLIFFNWNYMSTTIFINL